jgi:hypothetical protein
VARPDRRAFGKRYEAWESPSANETDVYQGHEAVLRRIPSRLNSRLQTRLEKDYSAPQAKVAVSGTQISDQSRQGQGR